MTPLPPDPPSAEDATTLPKLEQDTTPHINTEGFFAESTTDDDDTEDTSPPEKASKMTRLKTRRMKKKKI